MLKISYIKCLANIVWKFFEVRILKKAFPVSKVLIYRIFKKVFDPDQDSHKVN
jgi:hypothetical protein